MKLPDRRQCHRCQEQRGVHHHRQNVTSANNIKVDAEAVEYQVASSTLATVPTALKGTFDSLDKLKSARSVPR